VVGTWFLGVAPRLDEATKANSERLSIEFLNQQHAATLAALKEQFEHLPDLNKELDELRTAVPASDESAILLRQLQSLAGSAGVTLTDITLSSPEWFTVPAEAPADAEVAAALGSVGPQNFLAISLEQTVMGEHGRIMAYLDSLQKGQRTFLLHDLSFESGLPSADAQVAVTFTGQIFVLLDGVAAAAPAPAAGGAPVAGVETPQ
jgi:hypothetical protein